jgi:hypothetical protein
MENASTFRSRRGRAFVTLVHRRRTLIDGAISMKDLIDGGLARLLASIISPELNLFSAEDEAKSNRLALVEIGRKRSTRASRGGFSR